MAKAAAKKECRRGSIRHSNIQAQHQVFIPGPTEGTIISKALRKQTRKEPPSVTFLSLLAQVRTKYWSHKLFHILVGAGGEVTSTCPECRKDPKALSSAKVAVTQWKHLCTLFLAG